MVHPNKEVIIKGIKLIIKDKTFNPDPNITNSTSILVNNLLNLKEKKVLDVGCGSGIIAIFCALNGAAEVIASDIDQDIIENAKENVRLNKTEEIVKVVKSDLFENIDGKFDYILANLPISDKDWNLNISTLDLMKKCLSQSKSHLKKGGEVYFTWYDSPSLASLKDYLNESGWTVTQVTEKRLNHTWHLFKLRLGL